MIENVQSLPIPDAALEHHIAILGKTGSGKSNAAKVVAELLLSRNERVCIIDPTGTWYGMRLGRDGKKPSPWPIVIFGGNHSDLPLGPEHGGALAEAIGTSSTPAILDTRDMTVGARTRFFTGFAQGLLRSNRGTLTLIVDEAHLFAPQGRVADPKSGEMLHAANNLVSLGRGVGLRIILISQRPAKLHKDSLTQVETLVAMRVIAPQDRRAIEDWIGEWSDPKEGRDLVASLASLPKGDAWIWSPELGVLKRDHFPLVTTFDSGKPRASEGVKLKAIDVKTIAARLEEVAADALANDPARLKAEIARLKREMSQAAHAAAKAGQIPDPKVLEDAERRGYERGEAEGYKRGKYDEGRKVAHTAILRVVDGLVGAAMLNGDQEALQAAYERMKAIEIETAEPSAPAPSKVVRGLRESVAVARGEASPARVYHRNMPPSGNGTLGAERKPLITLASAYPGGLTEAQWATIAGFKRSGGTWNTYKSRLRSAGMIEQRGDLWHATEAGLEAIGGAPPAPSTPEERLAMWKNALGSGPSKILDVLVERYPDEVGKDDLADQVGMTATGGTFGTYLSRLSGNGLIERGAGAFRASEALFR